MSTLFLKFFHVFKTLFSLAIIKNCAIIQTKSLSSIFRSPALYLISAALRKLLFLYHFASVGKMPFYCPFYCLDYSIGFAKIKLKKLSKIFKIF